MPEDKLPSDFESLKPNIPDCWEAEPVVIKQQSK